MKNVLCPNYKRSILAGYEQIIYIIYAQTQKKPRTTILDIHENKESKRQQNKIGIIFHTSNQ